MGVIAVDRFQNRLLFARHEGLVARAPFVIVAQQVEDSMDQEARHFITQAVSEFRSLSLRGFHCNHDIAKQHGWTAVARPPTHTFPTTRCNEEAMGAPGGGMGGGERKREHVGRSVIFPIPAIEGAHTPIGDQHQAELRAVSARGRQDGLGCPAQPRLIDRHHALTILQDDGHGDQ